MIEPFVHIALPVMDEYSNLPRLLASLSLQTVKDFRLYVCVNQPESWWNDSGKIRICEDNQSTLSFLEAIKDDRIEIIDRSSPGLGWEGKNHGIGWARKVLMDHIASRAKPSDIILSLDADTAFAPAYVESVRINLMLNPGIVALSVQYYHPLTGEKKIDRAILRYEIYMRAYAINLWRINNPYSYTALGSAIALPVWAYKAIGGMTPKLSGEDFYFLQKLVKFGPVLHWNSQTVFPAGRLSERVFFGTGPALIRGINGDWGSYPVYPASLFGKVSETCKAFPALYEKDIATAFDKFFLDKTGILPWTGLRKNARSREQFVRACHEKLDGLRILQFLKESMKEIVSDNETATLDLLDLIKREQGFSLKSPIGNLFSFETSPVEMLDDIRNTLMQSEMSYRLQHWTRLTGLNSILN